MLADFGLIKLGCCELPSVTMRNMFIRSSVPWLLSQLVWLLVESLWARMKGKANKVGVVVEVQPGTGYHPQPR